MAIFQGLRQANCVMDKIVYHDTDFGTVYFIQPIAISQKRLTAFYDPLNEIIFFSRVALFHFWKKV